MCILAHYPVSAGHLLLLTGLRPVAHGGFCGTWAPAGNGLRLVCICNAMREWFYAYLTVKWHSCEFISVVIHPWCWSACSRSRTWDWRSLQWRQGPSWTQKDTWFYKCFSASASAVSVSCLSLSAISVCLFFFIVPRTPVRSNFTNDFLYFFPSPPVALMAVVALYFVDVLKGNEMAFWTLPPLHFSSSQFFFPSISHVTSLHSSLRLTHSLISHVPPPPRCRRRFEPVGRRQNQTPERSRFTGRVSSFDPSSASITAFRHTSHAVRRASKKHN